jgi:hypothetical protein
MIDWTTPLSPVEATLIRDYYKCRQGLLCSRKKKTETLAVIEKLLKLSGIILLPPDYTPARPDIAYEYWLWKHRFLQSLAVA